MSHSNYSNYIALRKFQSRIQGCQAQEYFTNLGFNGNYLFDVSNIFFKNSTNYIQTTNEILSRLNVIDVSLNAVSIDEYLEHIQAIDASVNEFFTHLSTFDASFDEFFQRINAVDASLSEFSDLSINQLDLSVNQLDASMTYIFGQLGNYALDISLVNLTTLVNNIDLSINTLDISVNQLDASMTYIFGQLGNYALDISLVNLTTLFNNLDTSVNQLDISMIDVFGQLGNYALDISLVNLTTLFNNLDTSVNQLDISMTDIFGQIENYALDISLVNLTTHVNQIDASLSSISLSQILANGNVANTNIDMSNHNIFHVNDISLTTINGQAYPPPSSPPSFTVQTYVPTLTNFTTSPTNITHADYQVVGHLCFGKIRIITDMDSTFVSGNNPFGISIPVNPRTSSAIDEIHGNVIIKLNQTSIHQVGQLTYYQPSNVWRIYVHQKDTITNDTILLPLTADLLSISNLNDITLTISFQYLTD
jgi:hypothetical protein